MRPEGLARIQARIDAIATRLTPAPAARSAGAAGLPSDAAFDVVFAEVLGGVAPAERAWTATAGTPTVVGSTAGLRDADGVPLELRAWGNGRIPPEVLEAVGVGSHRLWAPAARAFRAMVAAAAADGVRIGITDSYRDHATQVDLAARKGLYAHGGLAAVPGTSRHGWGLAVDLDLDPAAQAWMRANAHRFGFVENVPREPWHWEFVA